MEDRLGLPRSTASAALLVGLGQEYGVPAREVLEGCEIDLYTLHDPRGEITGHQEIALVRNLLAAVPVPDLGFVAGARYHAFTHGIWGYALMSSPTVRQALEVATRYADLAFSFARPRVVESATELSIVIDDADTPPDIRRFQLDRDLMASVTMGADVFGSTQVASRVDIALPRPDDERHAARYAEVLGVEPRWDAPTTRLSVPAELGSFPLPETTGTAAAMAERRCADLLRERRQRIGLAGQVRGVLIRRGRADVAQEEVAAALHLSVRTLRRRLADEGASFRDLVVETTGLLAEELLLAGFTVEEVSERLGYGSPSSFSRAFKAWRGVPPGRIRRDSSARR